MTSPRATSSAEHAVAPLIIDRYAIFDAIASGGMATVHLGRLLGPAGFSRTVAIKRLHPHYASDPQFTEMFLDEARMAARVQHPNVVPTLDVLQSDKELLLVMEYVRGDSLAKLIQGAKRDKMRIPPRIVVSILSGALQGLHAAHEATNEKGQPLGLIHRDVSPQNIIVGVDGTSRVLDFGVAKAEGRVQDTQDGVIKGKLLYMPPEQLSAKPITRTADIYSMGIVLFETLTGKRMFAGENDAVAMARILSNDILLPSEVDPALKAFDDLVRQATLLEPQHRFPTAREMSNALERCMQPASPSDVGAWVESMARPMLESRAKRVAEIESSSSLSIAARRDAALGVSRASDPGGTSGIQRTKIEPPPTSNRGRNLALGLGAMLVLAVIVIAYLAGTRATAPQATGQASGTPTTSSQPTEAVSASPPATTMPTAPTATATTVASVPPQRKVVPLTGGKPKPSCSPPYRIDKDGHKIFIQECL
jgi:eukaryotic-like serine/threonine-protein kinase